MKNGVKKFNHIRASFFWRTYLLNLILIFSVLVICLLSAKAILPVIAQEKSKMTTEEAAERVKQQTSVLAQQLKYIATRLQYHPSMQTDDEMKLVQALDQFVTPSLVIDNATVINKEGRVIAAYPSNMNSLKGKYLGYRPYFSETAARKEIYISDVFTAETGHSLLVIGVPILDLKGEVIRVIGLSIRLNENHTLQAFFQNIDLGGGGYVFIVDQTGRIFSHPQKERIGDDVSQNSVVQRLKLGKSGYDMVVNTKGVPMYASYRFVPGLNWGVVAQVPVKSTYESLELLESRVLRYLFIFLLPIMILVGLYTRRMINPIKQLHFAVDQVTKGNFEHHIHVHKDSSEIGILSQRFNQMIDHLRESRETVKESAQRLLEQKAFLKQVIDKNPSFIFARDEQGRYTLVNQTLADLLKTTAEEMVGKNVRDYYTKETADLYILEDKKVMESLREYSMPEEVFVDREGKVRWIQIVKIPIVSSDGLSHEVLTISTDISERKQRESEMQHLAYHDSLTGLPNRKYFQEQVIEALHADESRRKKMAVVFLDLDGFKHINDTLGHMKGDFLLKEVTQRLRDLICPQNVLARMGGDEFTLFIPEYAQEEELTDQVEKLLKSFQRPFVIDDQEFHLTTSIGISVYPKDAQDVDGLIKCADTAMYQAKTKGKNTYVFYTDDMSAQSWERLAIETYLRTALDKQEFKLAYQPKQDLKTGQICGVEALLRWENAHLGSVPPDKFIPLAEETGLIIKIGEWVLREACRQNKLWQEQGFPNIRMAVNLSARQLFNPNLLDSIKRVLEETELDPQWLELEITESTLMGNANSILSMLMGLKEMGIHLSIDDFGTGYSSLSYLKRFPVNTIKIDRSFIEDIMGDEDDQAIIRAIIAMARSLKLNVIAEGVETGEQLVYLREQGCHEIQGYVLSRPQPATELIDMLQVKSETTVNGKKA